MDDGGRISRRVLLGGAAAGIVGAGVAVDQTVGRTRVLYRLGFLSSPDHTPTVKGPPPETHTMPSKEVLGPVRYAISLPDEPTGVVICLHGRNGNHRTAFDAIRMHDMVAEAGERFVVVGIDGGPNSYWHERASGADPQAMVQRELLRRVETHVGTVLPRAIVGWSMGGYGALLAAQRAPQLYRAVAAASPALFRSFADSAEGAFDSEEDFRRHDVSAGVASLKDLVVRVDCGTDDPFLDASRSFARRLPNPNPGRFSSGFHDAAYWRSIAPAQVRTIAAAFNAT